MTHEERGGGVGGGGGGGGEHTQNPVFAWPQFSFKDDQSAFRLGGPSNNATLQNDQ